MWREGQYRLDTEDRVWKEGQCLVDTEMVHRKSSWICPVHCECGHGCITLSMRKWVLTPENNLT